MLISGHAPLAELGKGAFQEMAQAAIAAPVTKASWTVQSVDTLAADIVKAWREAKSGTPGPVHLSVPNDVLDAATTVAVPAHAAFAPSEEKDDGNAVSLGAAQRPLVIAGPAAMRKGTRELEEATGIPVIGMESPRGVNDPSLGHLAEVLARADLVLLLGKRVDFTLKFGKAFAPGCRVVQVQAVRGIEFKNNGWLEEVHAALRYRPPEWRTVQSKPEGPIHPVAAVPRGSAAARQARCDPRFGRRRVRPMGAGLPERAAPAHQRSRRLDRLGAAVRSRGKARSSILDSRRHAGRRHARLSPLRDRHRGAPWVSATSR